MVRRQLELSLNDEVLGPHCDFIFNTHLAHTERQVVLSETLSVSQEVAARLETNPVTHNRWHRLQAHSGPLSINYAATIDLNHHIAVPS